MHRIHGHVGRFGLLTLGLVAASGLLMSAGAFAQSTQEALPVSTPSRLASGPTGFDYDFLFGQQSGPFNTGHDFFVGASLDLPVFGNDPFFGQEFAGEIFLGYSRTTASGTFDSPTVTGGGVGVPVQVPAERQFNLTTLEVAPGLKYKFTNGLFAPTLFGVHIQPYVNVGIVIDVALSNTQNPSGGRPSERTGGIATISPQLASHGTPVGQGNVLIGGSFGGGVDFIVFNNILVGVDARDNKFKRDNADFYTIAGKFGFRF